MKINFGSVIAAVFMSVSGAAFAQDSSSGCGLGWQVTQKNSLVSSAIRSTTNVFLPNTFSMTFGSSGCAQHSIVKNASESQYFVEANLEQLNLDIARGDGEYLRGLAVVMGCESSYGEFSTTVQNGYSKIFSGSSTPASVLEGVKKEIRSSRTLSRVCGATS